MTPAEQRWRDADHAVEVGGPVHDDDGEPIVQIWIRESQRKRINDLKDEISLVDDDDGVPRQRDVLEQALDALADQLDDDLEEHREPTFDPAAISGEGVSGGRP